MATPAPRRTAGETARPGACAGLVLMPLKEKKITAEACVHHLHFTSDDYETLGNKIKCNPAIKAPNNKEALWKAVLDDRLDSISTDHAPHLLEEKYLTPVLSNEDGDYEKAHAGIPFVQHALLMMLHYVKEGRITIEKVVEKMSHAIADLYNIEKRGFIREGYFADLTVVDMNRKYTVNKNNILYKCGWSPLEGFIFPATITHTFVNGNLVYDNNVFDESAKGMRLQFDR